uniref:Ig-like domain-containing protein n=1 Tax=Junco hyemalis TaxID=40217 RepID=A0A8C5IW01_JUNHY
MPICVSWLPRGGFCPRTCSAPVQGPTSIALPFQPREVTVQEGKAVTLQCRMKGDSMRYYSVSWYRQGPTGSQEWIYKEDGTYGEGFKDRFQIKDEKFRNSFPLQIRAAEPADAATYYCQARITLEQIFWASAGLVHLARAPVQHSLISPLCLGLLCWVHQAV